MPKKEIDYSKTVIYKIVCNDLSITDCYVGHTTDFINRKYSHKANALNTNNKDSNMRVYQNIRSNGGWTNWSMIEVEKYPCRDANEARARERHWYEQINPALNFVVPNRSKAEWQNDNREEIAKKHHEYHIKHRDIIISRVKKYSEEHKEELIEYRKKYREEHKQDANDYYTKNKEKINAQRRERRASLTTQPTQQSTNDYYTKNKDKINAQRRKRYEQKQIAQSAQQST